MSAPAEDAEDAPPGETPVAVPVDTVARDDVGTTRATDASFAGGAAEGEAPAQKLTPVSPAGPAPWRRRPLKPAALELSAGDGDDNEDAMLFGATTAPSVQGAPRMAVPILRVTASPGSNGAPDAAPQQPPADVSAPRSRPVSSAGQRSLHCDDGLMALSERALRETQVLEALPFREVTMNEAGRVEIDGPQDAHRSPVLFDEFRHAEMQEVVQVDIPSGEEADAMTDATKMMFEAWCEWQQRCKEMQAVREELREQALLGHISANLMGLVAAAGGVVTTTSNVSLGVGVGMNTSEVPVGNEPPPTPAVQRKRRQLTHIESGSSGNLPVDQRYQHACTSVGMNVKPMVLRALRMVEGGKESLPRDFCVQAYLGNRGARALLLALASDWEGEDHEYKELSDLTELRTLNLAGHGMGNEAADSLCKLLPRCPRLQTVDLSRNHISELGAHRLLEEVIVHPALAVLKLDQNPVPSWLRLRFKEVLKSRIKNFSEDQQDDAKQFDSQLEAQTSNEDHEEWLVSDAERAK